MTEHYYFLSAIKWTFGCGGEKRWYNYNVVVYVSLDDIVIMLYKNISELIEKDGCYEKFV